MTKRLVRKPEAGVVQYTADTVGAITLPSYTVAGLAASLPPALNTGKLVHCSNGATGSPCLAYSNGTNWLRVVFGAAVAAT
jgi:hypothetical protein